MNGIEKLIERGRKEGLETGLEKGRKKGLEEGLRLGVAQGKRAALHHQLEQKFGALADAWAERVKAASAADLDSYLDPNTDGWIR